MLISHLLYTLSKMSALLVTCIYESGMLHLVLAETRPAQWMTLLGLFVGRWVLVHVEHCHCHVTVPCLSVPASKSQLTLHEFLSVWSIFSEMLLWMVSAEHTNLHCHVTVSSV